MKNLKAMRIGALVVGIGLLAVMALRQRDLSSSAVEGEGAAGGEDAAQKVTVRAVKPADDPIRTLPAPLRAASGGTKRGAGGSVETTYSLKHTTVLAYGKSHEQLGRISNGDVTGGPESFWVDKNGRIYICDTINGKIKVFSPSGVLLEEKAMGFAATDMVVADNGDMFVLDMNRTVVEQFGPDGQKKGSVVLKGRLAESGSKLRVEGNEVALQTNDQTEVALMEEGKSDLRSEVSEKSAKAGLKGLNGKRFQTLRNELRQGEVTIFDESGAVLKKLTLPVEGQVASIVYLGQDQADHSYFQVETSAESGVDLSVYSLDPDGNVVGALPQIPNDYASWTAKLLEIDGAGNIYQMLPTESGVQMNTWQRF